MILRPVRCIGKSIPGTFMEHGSSNNPKKENDKAKKRPEKNVLSKLVCGLFDIQFNKYVRKH